MPKTSDLIRQRLHSRLGIQSQNRKDPVHLLAEINSMTSSLETLVSLARPRLIMGGIRYGSEWEHKPLMEYMQKKFNEYKKTGNFENLVDFFNFIAVEGSLKTHPKFHFEAKDRK